MTRSADRPGLRSVLTRAGYRRLWAARTVSQAGDVVQFTTLALLVYSLAGSGLGVSGMVLAEIAPVLLLAPVAGPLVDRLPRVVVMVAADLLRLALAAALAVWHGDLAVVYSLAFGLSAGAVFFNPAAGSLLPTLVDDEELVAANSAIWSAGVLIQVAFAPVAGLLATAAGFGWEFAANAASFGLSALLLWGLRPGEAARPVPTTSIWGQARAGWVLLVLLAARRLGVTGAGYGLLLSAIGVGAFCGPLLLTRLGSRARSPRVLFGAFGLRGLVDLVLATVTALPAAVAALVAYGVGTSAGNWATAQQPQVPCRCR